MRYGLPEVPAAPSRSPSETLVAFTRDAFYEGLIWQRHDDVELTLVLSGRGQRGVGDSVESYEAGDLCIIGEGTPHGWQAPRGGPPIEALVVHFPRDLVALSESLPELRRLGDVLQQARSGLLVGGRTRDTVAEEILGLFAQPAGSWRRPLHLLGALSAVAEGEGTRRLATAPAPDRGDPRLARVLAYVEASLADGVSQPEAAARAGLTAAAFSRFFRRKTGRTFEEHVNQARVARACRALLATEASVTDVAFDAGFGSVAHFNRQFRRAKGMTPTAFRAAAIGRQ